MSGRWDDLFMPYYTNEPVLYPPPRHEAGTYIYLQATESDIQSPDPALVSLPSSKSTSQDESSQQSSESIYYDAQDWSSLPPLPPSPLTDGDDSCNVSGHLSASLHGSSRSSSFSVSTFERARHIRLPPSPAHPSTPVLPPSPASSSSPESTHVELSAFMLPNITVERLRRTVSRRPSSAARSQRLSTTRNLRANLFLPQSAVFPNEVFFMILCELPPRTAYNCRMVCKSWYREFWSVLVWNRWIPEVELFVRNPTSWIFEEYSAATHGGQRYTVVTKQAIASEEGVEFHCEFGPDSPPSNRTEGEALRRMFLEPVQIVAQFRSKRYWDFKIHMHLSWDDMTLSLDMKELLSALLVPEEHDWPNPSEIPRLVWRPPSHMSSTLGAFEQYRSWSPSL